MKIPRYWAQGTFQYTDATGQPGEFACWGWSDQSREDAAQRGTERARQVMERVLRGDMPGQYLYSDRPLREELIQDFTSTTGERIAAITRNAYGCQVLNTTNIAFIDVDAPPPSAGGSILQAILSLFGGSKESKWEQEAGARGAGLEEVLYRQRMGARVYRTNAGERYLLTGGTLDPASTKADELMEQLGTDPLYQKLCRVQECFRARLTPKPWRCGIPALEVRFPWHDEEAEYSYRRWEKDYQAQSRDYATCHFVEQLGSTTMSEDEQAIVKLHDEMTRAESELPLA